MFVNYTSIRNRAKWLRTQDPRFLLLTKCSTKQEKETHTLKSGLTLFLLQANLSMHWGVFVLALLFSCVLIGSISIQFLSPYCAPLFFAIGALIPYAWVSSRINKRALQFAEDFPSVLLATSASIRAGMTPLSALERAVELLPQSSLCKRETLKLMNVLENGKAKEEALSEYACTINLAEIELFRKAFLLVLENGGKFAPTLYRLARVTRDRTTLIASAQVSTASMRMTGTVLLCVIPMILGILSGSHKNYFQVMLTNSMANNIATCGIVIIVLGQIILRKMSNFKP